MRGVKASCSGITLMPDAVMTPTEFADRCRQIVATLTGDPAHRALDALVTELLTSKGYGEGMRIFVDGVAAAHNADCAPG